MLSKTYSATNQGVDALPIEVEVDIRENKNSETFTTIVGLPDTAVRESKQRIYSAILASGLELPTGFITVNLAPADIKKEGAAFDLPIALGIICCLKRIPLSILSRIMTLGELALDGTIRPVKGVLPAAILAKSMKLSAIFVPKENAEEAALVSGLTVYGVSNLSETVKVLTNEIGMYPTTVDVDTMLSATYEQMLDLEDVKGQYSARRALEIAAAGGHNLLFVGPPGTGKSMLAKRIPSILPPLTIEEALEVTKIHSIAGVLSTEKSLHIGRPFRAPHHTISDAGLLGGTTNPRPGEISLSHLGVLFLDELPEFNRQVLETLREPIENGEITISRANGSVDFPADFMFVGAMNPCPCGFSGSTKRNCRCTPSQVQKYRSKLSGPLLDRIDLHVEVPELSNEELLQQSNKGESSAEVRARVLKAREIQQERYRAIGITTNSQLVGRQLIKYCPLGQDESNQMRNAIDSNGLSARAYDRILRLARTIADLEESENIGVSHIFEALQYRVLDKKYW